MTEQTTATKQRDTTIAIPMELLESGQLALDEINLARGKRSDKRITQRALFQAALRAGLPIVKADEAVIFAASDSSP